MAARDVLWLAVSILIVVILIYAMNTTLNQKYLMLSYSSMDSNILQFSAPVPTSPVFLTVVVPYPARNRSTVVELLEKIAKNDNPCLADPHSGQPTTSKRIQLMLLVNLEPTAEDKKLEKDAKNILGKHASCFSRIFLSSAMLTEQEDEYPAGPTNMFFKPFFDLSLHQQFRNSTHMFWMEHDVHPIRSGWLDALLTESARGDFWVSGSVYMGEGFDNIAAVPANWNWVGHINGNALYNLKDPAFHDFLRLVIQYEPPNHFWKPFDVSIWRVLHAFPYTWPIYKRYRSKFVYSNFIHHWGFHITREDVAESIARQEVFLIHGANFSAGNVLVRPKPAPADVVWDDRVLPSARLSIMIRSTADEIDRAFNAAVHACVYVPDALEIAVVVPAADSAEFKARFKDDTRTAAVLIVGAGNLPPALQGEEGHHRWVGFHADTYCKGDIILHLSSDEVFNRLLELRDLLWLGRPMMVHRRYSGDGDDAEWAAGTVHFLGLPAAAARDFRTPHLHVYPRGLYAGVRRRVEIANGDTPFAKVLEAAERNRTRVSVRNVLGTYGLRFAPELVSPVPMDAADRRRMRLPTPVLIPPFFGAV